MDPCRGTSSRRSGRTRRSPNPLLSRPSNSRPAKPLSPIRVSPGRSAAVRAAWASSAAATSRSPSCGLARHQATGIPSGGGEQIQLQPPVPARMRRAVPVAGPPGQFGALHRFPGGAARHRRGIDQPHLAVPGRDLPGQVVHGRRQQRRGGLEPLVIPGLMRQVGEQVPQPGVAQPQPVMLRPGAQQHLRHRQAHQLRIRELLRPARATLARRDHMIVDQHIQCRQEGVEVCSHERPSMPSSLSQINPTRRTGPGWESLV
jgi:hypothetical protein